MKKIFVIITVVMLLLFSITSFNAANSTAALSGPSTVRAGDTITVTFKVNGTGILSAKGDVKYDSSKLTLTDTTQKIASPWTIDFNNTTGTVKFLAIDDKLSSPINSNKDLFTMTFKVKDLSAGTNVEISTASLEYSDGGTDTYPSTAKYSFSIAPPKSTNNLLKSLTVSNATISPAFNKNTTSYTANVPFSVSKLSVDYAPEDAKTTAAINNPNLVVGTTDVVITVTAESGAKKTYTIKVTRAQDPNYKASNDARLKELTLSTGLLSPAFKSDVTDYIVYVPFEVNKITVGGKAYDSKAQSVSQKSFDLKAGDNKLVITGTAEDGSKKDYTLHVIKMPEFDGKIPDIKTGEDIEKEMITGDINIKGKAEVGLTISVDSSIIQTEATVKYIWYAGDKLVGEGTDYNVSKADINKVITIKAIGIGDYEGELTSSGVTAKDNNSNTNVEVTPSVITIYKNNSENHLIVFVIAVVCLGVGIAIGTVIKKRSTY